MDLWPWLIIAGVVGLLIVGLIWPPLNARRNRGLTEDMPPGLFDSAHETEQLDKNNLEKPHGSGIRLG